MSKFSKSLRKTVRKDIKARLEATFGDLQQVLGKSKFKRKIKKVSKLLAADVKPLKPLEEAVTGAAADSQPVANSHS